VYTNAPYNRLITYNGSQPFTAGTATAEYVAGWDDAAAFPWLPGHFPATEGWAAMVDANGFGVGIVNGEQSSFVGGFAGQKGPGGPTDASTGYLAPTASVAIPPTGESRFTFHLVVGNVDTIRAFAWQVQGH
jgi:hypothetical protein